MGTKEFVEKIRQNRLVVDVIIIFLITLFLSIPMIKDNIDIYSEQGSHNLMRAYGTFKTLKKFGTDKIIFDFANNFGYSWSLFNAPLATYLVIILSMILGSFNIGFKMSMCIIIFLAGIFMYKFICEMLDNNDTALLASVCYMISPYFFTEIYIRFAINEALALIFIPMVFLGLYNLLNTERNHYYLIFGLSGLILSSKIIAIFVAFLSIIYCILNAKSLSSTKVKKGLILDFLFIICITSFYWMPALECRLFSNYQMYNSENSINKETFIDEVLNIMDLFITGSDKKLVLEIGLPILMMMIFSIMTIKRIETNKKEYLFFCFFGIISVWMATKYFPWSKMPNFVFKIKHPWEILSISTFSFSIACAINMYVLIKKFNIKDVIIISGICVIYMYSRFYAIPYSSNVSKIENYEIPKITGQNNEELMGMENLENLPVNAYNNTFYIATRQNEIEIIDGICNIENRKGKFFTAKFTTYNEKIKIELPYIYYPGYTVMFDGISQKTYETKNGFLGCTIDENESGMLEVEYTGTNIMKISQMVSSISIMIYIVYVWKKH